MNFDKIYTLVFLVTAFPPEISGASHFNWERAQWFAKHDKYRVVVFAPDWQGEANDLLRLSDFDNKLIVERYHSKPWIPYQLSYVPTFAAVGEINKKLASYKPDLIVMTDVERFFLLSAWRLPGGGYAKTNHIPYIAEYHTDIYNFAAAYPGWQWLRSLIRWSNLTKFLYRQLDLTVCSSIAASQSCKEMGISNVYTIPFVGIDVSEYNSSQRSRKWIEPWLSADEKDNKILLFLGRLGLEKRIDILIKAFSKLKQKKLKISLIIVGDGPAKVVKKLKLLAQTIPHVHFTGFIVGKMKGNLLASSDLFCSPSPYETFGRTLVEAMAARIPVLTVASGAVTEYINHETNGFLVPPNDVDSLALMIEKILNSDQQHLTQQAFQDAQQFSIEHSCQNLSSFYQKLLEGGLVL